MKYLNGESAWAALAILCFSLWVNITGCVNTTPGTAPPCNCPCDTIPTQPPIGAAEFMFGVNTNTWQPIAQQAKFKTVRLYQWTGSYWTGKGWYGQPLLQGQKQFLGLDDYLRAMKQAGTEVLFTLTGSPDYLNGRTEGYGTNNWPPAKPGADRLKPETYAEFSEICKATAIRYGEKQYPTGSYKTDPAGPRWNGDGPQEYKSGLGLIRYIEPGNEWDRWWDRGTEKYMTPEEQAALMLACYDAIKPTGVKVVAPGLTGFDLKRLEAIDAWCKARGRAFPADVVNVHHYSSTGNKRGEHPPTWQTNGGCAPGQDKDFETVKDIVAFSKARGLPVWVTEMGYDTNQGSQLYPANLDGKTAEQVQGDWLVASIKLYKQYGVERVYVFTLADEPNPFAGTFTSSGLLRGESDGYKEKPAMQAVSGLKLDDIK